MAEQLRRELAEIVRDAIKDPRLGLVSFTEARMSRDLGHAVVYCSFLENEKQNQGIEILNRASGFIRREVGKRIRARIVPTIKFVVDDSASRGAAMDELIREALEKDSSDGDDEGPEGVNRKTNNQS